MIHPLLAQLDNELRHRGELIFLQRRVGTLPQSLAQCKIPALVNPLTVEQLVGSITQQYWLVICSPTHINRAQWPGGKSPPTVLTQGGIIAASDPRVPVTSDFVYLRGGQKAIQSVAPMFDRGICIRIEIKVLG